MKAVKILFVCHLAALIFGLAGLLIALPNPSWWDQNPYGVDAFNFGIRYAGSLHIVLGAATMLLFGILTIGRRKTLIFFAFSTLLPLCMELLGTSTGFPFGPYEYTDFLGIKILGLVPYSIPLSWFYMGFTSFLLANLLLARVQWKHKTLWSLLIGVAFLTVWDLSLDPAMVSNSLPVHFWTWYESGPYFGMPIRNLVGWALTGLLYMTLSRWRWRESLDVRAVPAWLPFWVYAANTGFAIVLNLSTGLWIPPLIGFCLGLLPAALVLLRPARPGDPGQGQSIGREVARTISHGILHKGGQALLKRSAIFTVEGRENLPATGPTLIVAHHYHHLYDGCALLSTVNRRLHILVALDWIEKPWIKLLMEGVCGLAEWPVVLRTEQMSEGRGVYAPREVQRFLRQALQKTVQLLRHGETLVVFPEAYPTIDPSPAPERDEQGFLPFRPGFVRLIEMAERDQQTRVAIVPAGFSYRREQSWRITLRFGTVLFRQDFASRAQLVQTIEQCVRDLSISASSPQEMLSL